MSEVYCPQCHAANRPTGRFCSECGTPLLRPADSTPPSPPPAPAEQTAVPDAHSVAPDAQSAAPAEPSAAPDAPVLADAAPAPDLLLNRYRVTDELGRGGFGAVYRAWDQNVSRPCAVKENLDTSQEAQRQFSREATVLANLSHPNLPRVTDHFSIPGKGQYLVMDFVDGEDLATRSAREGRLPVTDAVEWVGQVAQALSYLHQLQPPVLHRDIKPANIRLTPEGRAMLVDFGLVKVSDPLLKTTVGARALTPGYAPPEQYGMGRTDARSDLYALAATLYKLITGSEPLESVQRMSGGQMTPAHVLNPAVPVRLSQVIEQALSLNPGQRFAKAAAFEAAMRDAVGLPIAHSQESERHPELGATMVYPAPSSPAQAERPAGAASDAPRPASGPRPGSTAPGEPARPASGPRPTSGPARPASSPPGTRPASGPPRPASGPRPPSAPRQGTAPQSTSAGRPWGWLAAAGAGALLLLCFVFGGGLLVFLGELDPAGATDTPGTRGALLGSDTPASTEQVADEATPDAPLPTPDPRFIAPDASHYVFANLASPDTLDPSLDYETTGLGIASNLYDTLIFYNHDDPDEFVPQLALEVPSVENGLISADGLSYTFEIRPGVRFHDGSPLTVEDVVYTFQRGMLQGGSNSPQWLLTEPLFGAGIYDVTHLLDRNLQDQPDALKAVNPSDLDAICQQVRNAVVADAQAGTVTFHLAQPWGPFLATLANAWGGVRSKAWTVANGGWDGDCSTWQNFYGRTTGELNLTPLGTEAMGSGPYKLDHWTIDEEIVLLANEDYWRTEPAWEGGPVGPPRLKTVTILTRSEFKQRLALLESGEADAINMESSADWPALDGLTGQICSRSDSACRPTDNPDGRLELIRGFPVANRNYDVILNWQINDQDGNDLLGSGKLDGKGIPPDFFSNEHVRRAFAACFNYDRFLQDVMQGEGIRTITVMPPDMLGYNANTPYYTYSPKQCEDELRQATIDGQSVWERGFYLVAPFNTDSGSRLAIANILRDEFAALDSRFVLDVRGYTSQEYANLRFDSRLPWYTSGWVQDIHDPHNWAYPYTLGTIGRDQGWPDVLYRQFQDLLMQAVAQTDPDLRREVYGQFNQLYHEQAPVILLFQPVGRHYQQRWVNGWYGNPVFPGQYYYVLWKN